MYNKLNTCIEFRKGHHTNCIRYVGNDAIQKQSALENRGDITHKPFIDEVEKISKNCLNTYKTIKNIKPAIKSRNYLSKEQDKVKFKNFKSKYFIKTKSKKISLKQRSKKRKSNKIKRKNKKKRSYI